MVRVAYGVLDLIHEDLVEEEGVEEPSLTSALIGQAVVVMYKEIKLIGLVAILPFQRLVELILM